MDRFTGKQHASAQVHAHQRQLRRTTPFFPVERRCLEAHKHSARHTLQVRTWRSPHACRLVTSAMSLCVPTIPAAHAHQRQLRRITPRGRHAFLWKRGSRAQMSWRHDVVAENCGVSHLSRRRSLSPRQHEKPRSSHLATSDGSPSTGEASQERSRCTWTSMVTSAMHNHANEWHVWGT